MAKQQNKQNVQGAQQQAYTSETNAASQSVIDFEQKGQFSSKNCVSF
jgi:hypothetical protein